MVAPTVAPPVAPKAPPPIVPTPGATNVPTPPPANAPRPSPIKAPALAPAAAPAAVHTPFEGVATLGKLFGASPDAQTAIVVVLVGAVLVVVLRTYLAASLSPDEQVC
jgi:hypothetical protein